MTSRSIPYIFRISSKQASFDCNSRFSYRYIKCLTGSSYSLHSYRHCFSETITSWTSLIFSRVSSLRRFCHRYCFWLTTTTIVISSSIKSKYPSSRKYLLCLSLCNIYTTRSRKYQIFIRIILKSLLKRTRQSSF